MSIGDWFKARDARRYTRMPEGGPSSADMPDGVWVKCEQCNHIVYEGQLEEQQRVCRHCGHHFVLSAPERIEHLLDEGTFREWDADLLPADPLGFSGAKTYQVSLDAARDKSDLDEAIVTGEGLLDGLPVALGVMDFRFIGATMGSVVGEKIARLFEQAQAKRLPVIVVAASGGARMQEGMLSLMQMAKTSAAVARHSSAGLAYVALLTNPTFGGVTASFAVLADVIIAEPGAVIGFAGPRVIEQTIHQKLPKGFRSAEFMLKHGMVDQVVPRSELRDRIALVLSYLAGGDVR